MSPDNDPSRDPVLTPAEKQVQSFSQQYAMSMELPFVLVGAIIVGGGAGFLLDRWLHTKPILMLVLGLLGFIGGLREILRRLPVK
jgi:ATP synthase protein I